MNQLTGEIDVKEFTRIVRLAMIESGLWKWPMIISLVMSLIIGLNLTKDPQNLIEWGFFCFFLLLAFYPYTIWPLKAKGNYLRQKQIHGPLTITYDDESISFISQLQETKMKWLYRYVVIDDAVLLYNTEKTFAIVLRRFCKDDEQFNQIIRVAEKIKNI